MGSLAEFDIFLSTVRRHVELTKITEYLNCEHKCIMMLTFAGYM